MNQPYIKTTFDKIHNEHQHSPLKLISLGIAAGQLELNSVKDYLGSIRARTQYQIIRKYFVY